MGLSFLNRLPGLHRDHLFQIRLDDRLVVLRGPENEAADQFLKGRVVLRLTKAMRVESIQLKMTGRLRVAWREELGTIYEQASRNIDNTTEVFSHQLAIFGNKRNSEAFSNPTVMNPGTYNWPFEIRIPGNSPESIQGPHKASISYEIEAAMARGKLLPTKYTSMPVRIIRSDPRPISLLEHTGRAEGVWLGKVEYRISLPQRTVSLGSTIHANICIKPLLQGVKVGKIHCCLMEIHTLQISTATHEACKEVAQWQFKGHNDLINDHEPSSYMFSGSFSLPKALSRCAQDVNVLGVKVRHLFSIAMEVQDPENQRSKIHVTLPAILSVSPDIVIDRVGNIVGSTQNEVSGIGTDIHNHAEIGPPLYEEHVLDQFIR